MRPAEIRSHIRAVPFVPVRIFLSDGAHYDVPHPELALVSAHHLIVAWGQDRNGVPRHTVMVDPVHVTRIEPLAQAGSMSD